MYNNINHLEQLDNASELENIEILYDSESDKTTHSVENNTKQSVENNKTRAEMILSRTKNKKNLIEEQIKAVQQELEQKLKALKDKQKETEAKQAEAIEKVYDNVAKRSRVIAKKWFEVKEQKDFLLTHSEKESIEKKLIEELVSVFKEELGAINS